MRYWLVMPAAGVGRRFGTAKPKQYAPLQGRTVIEWALAPFLVDATCAGIVVALAAEDPYWDSRRQAAEGSASKKFLGAPVSRAFSKVEAMANPRNGSSASPKHAIPDG